MAVALQQPGHHLAVQGDVFHHQHVQRPGQGFCSQDGRLAAGALQHQLEPEAAALAFHALHAQAPAHQFHQPLADGQAQAGAAIALGHRLAGLGEALEDLRLHLRGDADAVVGDADAQALRVGLFLQQLHLHQDLSVLGELHRVGQQVAQHLAQELLGAVALAAYPRVEARAQDGAVGAGPGLQQGEHLVEQRRQGEVHLLRAALAFFQAGEIEHFVEDRQQAFGGLVQGFQPLAVALAEGRATQQLGHAEDAVERGADFVAHGGEETRLGQVGRLGVFLGPLQAGGTPFHQALQGGAVVFAALDVVEDGPAHVVQRLGDGVDLILAAPAPAVQAQGLVPVAGGDAPGEVGHHPQVAGDQPVEQPGQRHRQAAEEHAHPREAGQAGGIEAPVDSAEVDGDLQLAQLPHLATGRLVGQGETLAAQRAGRVGGAFLQVEVAAAQAHLGDVGEVRQAAQLHLQLLLVEVPEAALEAGQVADADQRQARLDVAHLAAVFQVQLHRAGHQGEAEAEQQDEQQQPAQQAAGELRPGHGRGSGWAIMSR
ncbi:hypothetical protein D9M68_473100 [compost metagenome]